MAVKDLRIVVVDDSVFVRDCLNRALPKIDGCRIVGLAADGEEALRMIHALEPNIVVLDIAMPVRNGIEVLQEIRRRDSTTTVIMFTSSSSLHLKQVCFDAGADYYLEKTQFDDLLNICRLEQLNVD
ncbi:MAG: response regulator [Blastocatellia bacterium]|nr:MAG: response regulator [Blastocatellia bacterium]